MRAEVEPLEAMTPTSLEQEQARRDVVLMVMMMMITVIREANLVAG